MDEGLWAERIFGDQRERRNGRGFFARTLGSLAVALLAFSATVFFLARLEREDPRAVVTAQLDALSRGDIARAYLYFSDSYRTEVSLEAFHRVVAVHRSLFRPRQVRFARCAVSGNQADLELRVTTASGTDYPVQYHLVRERGSWRVADFRYHLDANAPDARERSI